MRDVEIERLSAYLPMYSLALDDLAALRGIEPQKYRLGLGLEAMAIAPPCEDTVTLAANAAAPLFAAGLVDPHEIGLLLVATESAVDHGDAPAADLPPDGFRGYVYYAGTERDRRRYLPTR